MPTVLRRGPYRVYFFSNDREEPPHVHVDRGGATAKFWLTPVALSRNGGFPGRELRTIASMLEANETGLLEAWHAFFEG